ncbi:dihydropteroate synthase [Parvibaculaceae bacterium PLY_AMNH_Bact1]|nr:dihydropteroate synthase [Parvibaculaceae bacterium PLY_AMNH_Bact1]
MKSTPSIFGILNITSDSFSDGGKYLDPAAALAHGRKLMADGAHVLDIGPASSHPDSAPVSAAEEIRRLEAVVPVLQAEGAVISVDTFQTETQRWALTQEVAYLNDIQGFADESFYPELAEASANLIVMHSIQGRGPATRAAPPPGSMVDHVSRFFDERFGALQDAGVARGRLILDPGMGFFLGNQPDPSLEVIRGLGVLKERFGVPVLVSVSRKSFLRKLAGAEVGNAAAATLAAELFAASAGANMIRTHEPRQLADSLTIWGHLAPSGRR